MRSLAHIGKVALCTAMIILPVAAVSAADHPNIQPGNWELAVSSEMPNMPPRPPMTMTHCIKPEDVKDGKSFAEAMQKRQGKCTLSDMKLGSDKLSFSFACESGDNGTSEMVFSGGTYEGTTTVNIAARNNRAAMTMTQHVKARRTGDC